MALELPARNTVIGAETRLLLAECRSPSFSGFALTEAKKCMQLMDLVLWNRLRNNPSQFMARGATTIIDIIKAPGQFHGFEKYPHYSAAANNQAMLDIANNPKDSRQATFADFINTAIEVAKTTSTIADPSGGIAAAWRTAGASSPGSSFAKFDTVGGNDFYRLI